MEFKLQISFSAEQLESIDKAGLRVILAKQNSGRGVDVAWQAIDPMPFNEIIWQEKYGIYASNVSLSHGAVLTKPIHTRVGAASDKLYILTYAGVITDPGIDGPANSFTLRNQYDEVPMMTIGLFQDANVNGDDIAGNACSAAVVLKGSTAIMTPHTTISVWLQSHVKSNTVVTTVTSPVSNFKFGGDLTAISIVYDSESGWFSRAS